MTVTTLGRPADLEAALRRRLDHPAGSTLVIRVIPRDEKEIKCGARWADHYEARVYYTVVTPETLPVLEGQLQDIPGVYATTQVHADPGNPWKNVFTNPGWPAKLGIRRRDRNELRPQVLALIRDPEGKPS
jgi:hypothetical protein